MLSVSGNKTPGSNTRKDFFMLLVFCDDSGNWSLIKTISSIYFVPYRTYTDGITGFHIVVFIELFPQSNDLAEISAAWSSMITLQFQSFTSVLFDEPSFPLAYDETAPKINNARLQNV